jgi:hypothetical protein
MSKKTKVAAPDYTSLANASVQTGQMMADLGYAQMAQAQSQFNQSFALASRVANQQLSLMKRSADQADYYLKIQADATERQLKIMEENAAMGREYYDYMKETFRPLEQQMVADALKYNSNEEFERQAGIAAADVASRSSIERAANDRAMASMGVNPNSGRALAIKEQSGLQNAAIGAGAMNQARKSAEMTGYAKMMDAIGIGRGLPAASQGAYALAAQTGASVAGNATQGAQGMMQNSINAGNSAVSNFMQPGVNLMSGLAQGAATIGSGQSMMLGGLGNALSGQSSLYNAQQQNNAANAAGWGSFLGGALAMM